MKTVYSYHNYKNSSKFLPCIPTSLPLRSTLDMLDEENVPTFIRSQTFCSKGGLWAHAVQFCNHHYTDQDSTDIIRWMPSFLLERIDILPITALSPISMRRSSQGRVRAACLLVEIGPAAGGRDGKLPDSGRTAGCGPPAGPGLGSYGFWPPGSYASWPEVGSYRPGSYPRDGPVCGPCFCLSFRVPCRSRFGPILKYLFLLDIRWFGCFS